jgi:hypothetical protein
LSEQTIQEQSEDFGRLPAADNSYRNDVDYESAIEKMNAQKLKLEETYDVPEQEFSQGKKAYLLDAPRFHLDTSDRKGSFNTSYRVSQEDLRAINSRPSQDTRSINSSKAPAGH